MTTSKTALQNLREKYKQTNNNVKQTIILEVAQDNINNNVHRKFSDIISKNIGIALTNRENYGII